MRTRGFLLGVFGLGTVPLATNAPVAAQATEAGLQLATLMVEYRLPRSLTEISGLAFNDQGRLFGHEDETGHIFEIDRHSGEIRKSWVLGDKRMLNEDFEGIAVVGDRFYLGTSDGRIYEAREGENEKGFVLYHTYRTGLGRHCEVEGLAYEPSDSTLLLPCKTNADSLGKDLLIYRWSLAERAFRPDPIRVDGDLIDERIGKKSLRPSGIERHPQTGRYFLVSAIRNALIEIDREGTLHGVWFLDEDTHHQPEGITFDDEGILLIADEGGVGRGTLSLYRR